MAALTSANQTYCIYRVPPAPGAPKDTVTKVHFWPPKGSDELFEALRLAYPHIKTHKERKMTAIVDFHLQERDQELIALSSSLSFDSITASSTATASGSLSGTSPSSMPADLGFNLSACEDVSQPSPFDTDSAFMSHALSSSSSCQSQSPSTSFQTLASSQSPPKNGNPSKSPSMQEMTNVWSTTGISPRIHTRRTMTAKEKAEYRLRRQQKACLSCKKRKRKCLHDATVPEGSAPQASPARKVPRSGLEPSAAPWMPVGPSVTDQYGTDILQIMAPHETYSNDTVFDEFLRSLEDDSSSQLMGSTGLFDLPALCETGIHDAIIDQAWTPQSMSHVRSQAVLGVSDHSIPMETDTCPLLVPSPNHVQPSASRHPSVRRRGSTSAVTQTPNGTNTPSTVQVDHAAESGTIIRGRCRTPGELSGAHGVYYNAAAHLRRSHFSPTPRQSNRGEHSAAALGSTYGTEQSADMADRGHRPFIMTTTTSSATDVMDATKHRLRKTGNKHILPGEKRATITPAERLPSLRSLVQVLVAKTDPISDFTPADIQKRTRKLEDFVTGALEVRGHCTPSRQVYRAILNSDVGHTETISNEPILWLRLLSRLLSTFSFLQSSIIPRLSSPGVRTSALVHDVFTTYGSHFDTVHRLHAKAQNLLRLHRGSPSAPEHLTRTLRHWIEHVERANWVLARLSKSVSPEHRSRDAPAIVRDGIKFPHLRNSPSHHLSTSKAPESADAEVSPQHGSQSSGVAGNEVLQEHDEQSVTRAALITPEAGKGDRQSTDSFAREASVDASDDRMSTPLSDSSRMSARVVAARLVCQAGLSVYAAFADHYWRYAKWDPVTTGWQNCRRDGFSGPRLTVAC